MHVTNIVPVIGVKNMAVPIAFYRDLLGFEVVYQTDWYAHLRASGDPRAEIGFVMSHHPMQPEVFQARFDGNGLFYSFEVEDVDKEYRRLRDAGVTINLELRDEPWGERHFAVRDPNGVYINVSHTDAAQRGKVDVRDHLRHLEKEVQPPEGGRVARGATLGGK